MGKVVTFGTLKGGTGKSTTAFTTAGILADRGYNTLVIDVDPQANLTSNFGIDETKAGYKGVKHIFEDENIHPDEVIVKAPLKRLATLDVIGSNISLTSTEMKIISFNSREFILKHYLCKYKEVFSKYDYIIIDTNPSMSILNQNAFIISDGIILVTDVGINGIKGLELFIALWEDIIEKFNRVSNIKGILINKFNNRGNLSKEFVEYCQQDEDIRRLLFRSSISMDEKIVESELSGVPINLYDNTSNVFNEFNLFVDELMDRLL